ncbi:MAG: hypothetical protein H7833_11910 [Magnetococcus sp. DMHC-1]
MRKIGTGSNRFRYQTWRILATLLGIGGLLLSLSVILIGAGLFSTWGREWVLEKLAEKTGWRVTVNKVGWMHPWPTLHLGEVTGVAPDGTTLTLAALHLGMQPGLLLQGVLSNLELDQLRITLPHAKDTSKTSAPKVTQPVWPGLPVGIDRIHIRDASLTLGPWHLENIHIRTSLHVQQTTSGKISGSLHLDVNHFQAAATTPEQVPARGSGKLTGTFSAAQTPAAIWKGQFALQFRDVVWHSGGAGDALVEGLAGGLSGTLNGDGKTSWNLKSRLQVQAGEWLADKFYGNLHAEHVVADLAWRQIKKGTWSGSGVLTSATLGEIHAGVDVQPHEPLQGWTRFSGLDLGKVLHGYLREPLAETLPVLAKGELRGILSGELAWRFLPTRERPELQGNLRLENGFFAGADNGFRVGEAVFDLPFASEPLYGFLRLQDIHLGKLVIPALTAQPGVVGDDLLLAGDVVVPLAGGSLTLAKARLDAIGLDWARLSLALEIDHLDLGQLVVAQADKPLVQGQVTGQFPEIVLERGKLTTTGDLTAHLFGGKVRLSDLGGDRLSSTLPEWRARMDLDRLDLGELTQFMEVGRIEGTLSGSVQELIMAGSEPVAFKAEMASVESSAPQRISVRAIEQINLLGSGSSGFLQRGLLSMFKDYGYRALGFRCQLRHDTFHLHGMPQADGDEQHLVAGSLLPPRVNVVIHSSVIGWKDMMNRLQRIRQADDMKNNEEKNQ